jgi:hypothetical protein
MALQSLASGGQHGEQGTPTAPPLVKGAYHLRSPRLPLHIPSPGRFLLVVNPIIGRARLTKVLMDGGSGLNILYASTLDRMGIPRASLRPSGAPFFEVILGIQATPLGSIQLPITFRDPSNF